MGLIDSVFLFKLKELREWRIAPALEAREAPPALSVSIVSHDAGITHVQSLSGKKQSREVRF
jgi:hypothetical protein